MQKEQETENFVCLDADLKEACKVLGLSRRALAEMVNIDPRYLVNIENSGSLPQSPGFYQLVKICKLPVERYFFPVVTGQEDKEREQAAHKLRLCPKEYLPIIEAAIDGAISLKETEEAFTLPPFSHRNVPAWKRAFSAKTIAASRAQWYTPLCICPFFCYAKTV